MIQGLSHITIIVKDLEKTSRLLCDGLGAEEVYDSKDKNYSISREKYFILGGIWLVAMEGSIPEKSYRHIAFQVDEKDLADIEKRMIRLGASIAPSRSRVAGEGKSLYFYDFDNNLFELHSGDLDKRLSAYRI